MSAYICSDITFDNVLALIHAANRGPRNDEPIPDIHYLDLPALTVDPADEQAFRSLAQEIFALNCRGVDARYGQDKWKSFNDGDVYQYRPARPVLDPVAAYRSFKCLLYQCSEGDVANDPLYKALEALAAELAEQIVRSSPEYKALPWQ